ncbi:hypothetical protein M8818_002819 [Zalaria obscura]|uniref:Uncharacterized protein n=1 Tax=Zalaria obscura TaxID=2024903 RepID=A0ACC3SHV5_9PEZI
MIGSDSTSVVTDISSNQGRKQTSVALRGSAAAVVTRPEEPYIGGLPLGAVWNKAKRKFASADDEVRGSRDVDRRARADGAHSSTARRPSTRRIDSRSIGPKLFRSNITPALSSPRSTPFTCTSAFHTFLPHRSSSELRKGHPYQLLRSSIAAIARRIV